MKLPLKNFNKTTLVIVGTSLWHFVIASILSFCNPEIILVGPEDGENITRFRRKMKFIEADLCLNNAGKFVHTINSLRPKYPNVLLIASDVDGAKILSCTRNQLRYDCTILPDVKTLEMFDDKWRFYNFCKEHLFPVPTTIYFSSKAEMVFSKIEECLSTPFVIKPTNASFSKGVCIINNESELERNVLNNKDYNYTPLLAQQYIEGKDIDLSLLSYNGNLRAAAIQTKKKFVTSFCKSDELLNIAHHLACLNYNGLMHVDARLQHKTGKIFLIESNPRFWASMSAATYCGLNFVEELINAENKFERTKYLLSGNFKHSYFYNRPSVLLRYLFGSDSKAKLFRASVFNYHSLVHSCKKLPRKILRLTHV